MLYIAITIIVILFVAAGYIAFMNSRIIANKKRETHIPLPASEYTVYMTPHFSEEDQRSLIPIGVMEFRNRQEMMKVYLCRVKNASGDLKLEQAGEVFLLHLKKARDDGTLVFYQTVEEALIGPEEKAVTDGLSAAAKQNAKAE